MAVTQDTYRDAPGRGFPGMVANGETSNRISRTCEDVAGIPFGAPVFDGAGDHGCSRTQANRDFLGFAMADVGVVPLPGGVAADIFPQYSSVGIMTLGAICVLVAVNVAKRNPVYVTPGGTLTNVANGNLPATGWIYDETVAAGGVCRIVRR